VVAALLAEACRRCTTTAYLLASASNAPALALYRHFGFSPWRAYGYRARAGEPH
jgi:ribosomal protein S18 acetylase RimI-like enzyme